MTIYYVDYDNGADTNNGTAKATPFKNIPGSNLATNNAAAASRVRVAGNSVLLARGATWLEQTRVGLVKPQYGTGTLTYGAYDRTGESGQPDPIIDTRKHWNTPGDWTHEGSGIWSADLTGTVHIPFLA